MTTLARRKSLHTFAHTLLHGKDNYAHYLEVGGRVLLAWDTRRPVSRAVTLDEVIGTRRSTPPAPADVAEAVRDELARTGAVSADLAGRAATTLDRAASTIADMTESSRNSHRVIVESVLECGQVAAERDTLRQKLAATSDQLLDVQRRYADLVSAVTDAAGFDHAGRKVNPDELPAIIAELARCRLRFHGDTCAAPTSGTPGR